MKPGIPATDEHGWTRIFPALFAIILLAGCARPEPVHTTAEIARDIGSRLNDKDWNPRQVGTNAWLILTFDGGAR